MSNNKYPRGVIVSKGKSKDEAYFDEKAIIPFKTGIPCPEAEGEGEIFCVRSKGGFKGRGLWLDNNYEWEIVRDSVDALVLVATRK